MIATLEPATERLGIALILLGSVLIGLMPAAATFAYADGANALAVLLGRSAVGVMVLLVYFVVMRRPTGVSIAGMRRAIVPGFSHVLLAIGLFVSILYIDIPLASIIIFLYPFPIAVVSHLRGETPLTPAIVGLMVMATAGLALVLGVSLENLDLRGIAIAVLGLIAVTVMIITMADLTRIVGAPNSNLLMTIWTTLIFAAVAVAGPFTGLTDALRLPATTAGLLYIAAVGITFSLGYLCFFLSAHIIGVARTSLLSTAEPIMIILFAVVLVGRP